MNPKASPEFKAMTLRLPADLYQRVASIADKERRTMTAQVTLLIELGLSSTVAGVNAHLTGTLDTAAQQARTQTERARRQR